MIILNGISKTDIYVIETRFDITMLPKGTSLVAHMKTQVQSLGWKDPLEKGMTTHSSILA